MKEKKSENVLLILLNAVRSRSVGAYASLFIVGLIGIAILVTVSQIGQRQDPRGQAAGGLPNRVAWQNQDWFLLGANVPRYNWACDFGCNQNGGVVGNKSILESGFQKLKDNNVHVARWWVFPGDPWQITRDSSGPTGLNPAIYADFDAALELAEQYDLYYDFVLFSAATHPPSTWLTDVNQRTKLGQVLAPLFQRYANNPRVMSWEILNEPEWQIWSNQISEGAVVETSKVIANTIHANSPTLVTLGQATALGLPMWKDVALDFYSPHWYPNMTHPRECPICETADQKRALLQIDNKPVVIGEMYMGADTLTQMNNLYQNGYAGGWGWSLFPDRTSDKITIDFGALNTFTQGKTDIGPKSSGIPTSTTDPTLTPTKTPTPTSPQATPTRTPTPISISATNTPTPTTSTQKNAVLSLLPATQTVKQNNNFAVTVSLNTGGIAVNAVDVKISYPNNSMQLVNIDTGSSAFEISATETIVNGVISLVRGTTTPVNGTNVRIAILNFKALTVGSASISFNTAASRVVSANNAQDVLADTLGSTIIIQTPKTGDLNNDGAVNEEDLAMLIAPQNFSLTNPANPQTDINLDGIVNIFDLSILLSNFGK